MYTTVVIRNPQVRDLFARAIAHVTGAEIEITRNRVKIITNRHAGPAVDMSVGTLPEIDFESVTQMRVDTVHHITVLSGKINDLGAYFKSVVGEKVIRSFDFGGTQVVLTLPAHLPTAAFVFYVG